MPLALALFTGSLDSMLAVRALREQGFEVEAMHVRTVFGCGRGDAESAAEILGIPLVTLEVGDDYLDVFRRPRFGFRKGLKSFCVDCRIHICRMARRRMDEIGASLIISGEVLGQRSPGQRHKDLEVIAHHSGLEGRLLRPLSAQLLPETEMESAGLVDRGRLFAFHGSGRRELIALAERWGFSPIPPPSNGCAAAQKQFALSLGDLLAHQPDARREDFELLRIGRHFRVGGRTKIVLGRNEAENALLRQFAEKPEMERIVFLEPNNFSGPSAMVAGEITENAIREAAGLMAKKIRPKGGDPAKITVRDGVGRVSDLSLSEG
jgi:tRNA-uridine 2-sulfurtransferase